jgi:hypothetical protein
VASSRDPVDLEHHLARVFTPASPVLSLHRLHGREKLVEAFQRAWNRRGCSVVIFGERGVGKTSILRCAAMMFKGAVFYHSASLDDRFDAIMLSALEHFGASRDPEGLASGRVTPQAVVRRLPSVPALLLVDDFERIESEETRVAFADLIKKLSDSASRTTLAVAGVGCRLEDLIEAHESIRRHVVVLEVPSLGPPEIRDLVRDGISSLGLKIEQDAVEEIVRLSGGALDQAHLLCEAAVHELLAASRLGSLTSRTVALSDVLAGLERAAPGGQYRGPASAATHLPIRPRPVARFRQE